MHRPGTELRRITPRTAWLLESGRVPWMARAQEEHDKFADVLRDHGVQVHYLADLLAEVLRYRMARQEAISAALAGARLGLQLEPVVSEYLHSLGPADLACTLIAGLTPAELPGGRGLVFGLLGTHDFVLEPAANLVFSRDSSVVIGDQVVLANLAGPRRREAGLLGPIYRHHPMFAGLTVCDLAWPAPLDGADIVLLAPGVVAIGVGARTAPAAAEALARRIIDAGAARTVLAVPLNGAERLDMMCTVVAPGTVIMARNLAFTLTALTITARDEDLAVSRPWPFLEAAAAAMGVDRLTVIETGAQLPGEAGQWEDGGNALALGNQIVVCDERNTQTNARLSAAGFRVVGIPVGELGGDLRGGPRCLCAVLERDSHESSAGPVTASKEDEVVLLAAGAAP